MKVSKKQLLSELEDLQIETQGNTISAKSMAKVIIKSMDMFGRGINANDIDLKGSHVIHSANPIGRCVKCGRKTRLEEHRKEKGVYWIFPCSCRDDEYDTFWAHIKKHFWRWHFKIDCMISRLWE